MPLHYFPIVFTLSNTGHISRQEPENDMASVKSLATFSASTNPNSSILVLSISRSFACLHTILDNLYHHSLLPSKSIYFDFLDPKDFEQTQSIQKLWLS